MLAFVLIYGRFNSQAYFWVFWVSRITGILGLLRNKSRVEHRLPIGKFGINILRLHSILSLRSVSLPHLLRDIS